tara:strand:+ start:2886 stop:3185 length:300 start_codon:yes stop_codon:yes gene_type:complete
MGQYGNQPDFGTEADDDVQIVTKAQSDVRTGFLGGACLYVGTGGDINVIIAGTRGGGQPYDTIFFKAVPSGSILPVIVDYVADTGPKGATTAADLVALK